MRALERARNVLVCRGTMLEAAIDRALSVDPIFGKLKQWALTLKRQSLVVYFAARDSRTPLVVRLLALGIAAYALSPIDLIPDFIPVLGYLDDVIIVPLGVALVIRLIPEEVAEAAKVKAAQASSKPVSYAAGFFIVTLWLLAIIVAGRWLLR
jgi:uncharacterized membrane protein YkvA (DUF1232 family)